MLRVTYYDTDNNPLFVLTSKEGQGIFYLYEVLESGALKKLGKSKSPKELEVKFSVYEKMRGGK